MVVTSWCTAIITSKAVITAVRNAKNAICAISAMKRTGVNFWRTNTRKGIYMAMTIDSGVRGYVKGTATIVVNFPIDNKGREYVRCVMCPYLSNNEKICRLNGEIVAFPKVTVGDHCPLEIEEPKVIPEGLFAFGEEKE